MKSESYTLAAGQSEFVPLSGTKWRFPLTIAARPGGGATALVRLVTDPLALSKKLAANAVDWGPGVVATVTVEPVYHPVMGVIIQSTGGESVFELISE